ncbi:MAG: DUF58 domain-containing protein [Acidimicrobiales bacterium]
MYRTICPSKVQVGEAATVTLTISNPAMTPIVDRLLHEHIGDQVVVVPLRGLAPHAVTEHVLDLPTGRRGVFPIGPLVISRADPLGLLRRDVVQSDADELWVRPRVVPTHPAPVGFAKDLEGPTNDLSPAGDVSFHALREYNIGDDPRHVHWLSTARTGTLMVKHFVDNRRPYLTVVVDASAESYRNDGYEVAVDILASLGVSGLVNDQPVSLYNGQTAIVSAAQRLGVDEVLDSLTLISGAGPADLAGTCSKVLDQEPDTSVLVVVTGPASAERLLPVVNATKQRAAAVIVRIGCDDDGRRVTLPAATLIDADDVTTFGDAWNQVMR